VKAVVRTSILVGGLFAVIAAAWVSATGFAGGTEASSRCLRAAPGLSVAHADVVTVPPAIDCSGFDGPRQRHFRLHPSKEEWAFLAGVAFLAGLPGAVIGALAAAELQLRRKGQRRRRRA
jgi:hypothetical protein